MYSHGMYPRNVSGRMPPDATRSGPTRRANVWSESVERTYKAPVPIAPVSSVQAYAAAQLARRLMPQAVFAPGMMARESGYGAPRRYEALASTRPASTKYRTRYGQMAHGGRYAQSSGGRYGRGQGARQNDFMQLLAALRPNLMGDVRRVQEDLERAARRMEEATRTRGVPMDVDPDPTPKSNQEPVKPDAPAQEPDQSMRTKSASRAPTSATMLEPDSAPASEPEQDNTGEEDTAPVHTEPLDDAQSVRSQTSMSGQPIPPQVPQDRPVPTAASNSSSRDDGRPAPATQPQPTGPLEPQAGPSTDTNETQAPPTDSQAAQDLANAAAVPLPVGTDDDEDDDAAAPEQQRATGRIPIRFVDLDSRSQRHRANELRRKQWRYERAQRVREAELAAAAEAAGVPAGAAREFYQTANDDDRSDATRRSDVRRADVYNAERLRERYPRGFFNMYAYADARRMRKREPMNRFSRDQTEFDQRAYVSRDSQRDQMGMWDSKLPRTMRRAEQLAFATPLSEVANRARQQVEDGRNAMGYRFPPPGTRGPRMPVGPPPQPQEEGASVEGGREYEA